MERSDINRMSEFDPTPSMYYVYILRNNNNKLYYGYTNNLKRRLQEHGAKYNFELIYFEAYKSESDARNREKQLKNYAQSLTALKSRLKKSLSGVGCGV